MTATEDILHAFERGELVRPSADVLNFVDLVRAVLALGGSEAIDVTAGVDVLRREIGAADHYLLVLVDGLGIDFVNGLPANAFMRKHLAREIQAVFLPSTATALTTLATGRWPAAHGVPGWWTYLPDFDCSAVTLPFIERETGRPLGDFGIAPEDLLPAPSLWPTMDRAVVSLFPSEIADTTYTRYSTGRTRRIGYGDVDDAIALAEHCVLNATRPSLTYLYLPHLDSLAHDLGTEHPRVRELAIIIDMYLAELASALKGRARMVIVADHGLANAPMERVFVLSEDGTLQSHLTCQPSGEPTAAMFHVRPGREEAFAEEFRARLGEHFILLASDEVEELRLLGPGPLSPVMKGRLGTFVGIARRPAKLYVQPTIGCQPENPGVHGGLTREEMWTPLILA